MAMSIEDQSMHEIGFFWENQLWGFSNIMSESKENLDLKLPNLKEGNEEEPLINKKRSRENASGSGKKIIGGEAKDGKSRDADHEIHIWTERERRKKMRNMFASLHALLPQLPSKADKSTIVDEAVRYIKSLNQTLEKLEKQKQERLQSASLTFGCESSVINSQWYPYDSKDAIIANYGSSSNMSSAIGIANPSNSALVSVPQQPVAFQTWSSPNVVLNICGNEAQFCIIATRKPGLLTTIAIVLEKHKLDVITANILCNGNGNRYMIEAHANRALLQFPEASSVGEIYKQAAREIMRWIS